MYNKAGGGVGILKTVTGNPISVTDALAAPIKSLSVSLSPIQAGSGDPYPAGGGKNLLNYNRLLPEAVSVGCTVDSDGNIKKVPPTGDSRSWGYATSNWTVTLPAGTYTLSWVVSTAATNSAAGCRVYSQGDSMLSSVIGLNFFTVGTHSVTLVLHETTSIGIIIKQYDCVYKIQLEGGSTATAWSPYENIRPITGRTAVTVTRTGKNILNLDNFENGLMSVYIGDSISAITQSARYIHSATYDASKGLYVTAQSLDASKIEWCVLCVYNNDVLANRYFLPITGASPATVSIASETYEKAIIQFGAVSGNIALSCIDSIKASFSIGSTATDYEPYDDQSATIQLGQTVYGGTVDVIAGKLTVNWAKIVLNGTQQISRENWKPQAKSVGWIYPYDLTRNIVGTGAVLQNIKCDTLPSMPFNSLQSINGPGIALASNQTYGITVMYPDPSLTTASTINAFLAEHPIDVVYELAEPFDIDLTPAQLTALKGDNTVWSDGDDISMTYKAASS